VLVPSLGSPSGQLAAMQLQAGAVIEWLQAWRWLVHITVPMQLQASLQLLGCWLNGVVV
jgi:hypothetical protein